MESNNMLHFALLHGMFTGGNSHGGGGGQGSGSTDLSAVDVFVGDYLSETDLVVTTGAVDRYRRYIVGG